MFALPASAAQPLLQGRQRWIDRTQGGKVGPIADPIEPGEHRGLFLAPGAAELGHRHLDVLHGSSDHTAEALGGLRHGQFVTRQLDGTSHPPLSFSEGERGEGANVVDGHHLQRRGGHQRFGERAAHDGVAVGEEVLHEEHRPQDRVREPNCTDVFFDLVPALEMRNTSLTVGAADRAVDHVLDAGGLGRVGEGDALP